MYRCTLFGLLVYVLVLLSWCSAEETYLEHYTSADGLGSDVVHDIFIASDGTKWFGTDCGLSEFDGEAWSNYLVEPAAPGSRDCDRNIAKCVTVDELERMWVAFPHNGARRFLAGGFDRRIPGDDLVCCPTCLAWTKDGDLWVGSVDWIGRYNLIDGWRFFSEWSASSQPYGIDYALNFAEEPSGILWIGTYAGVWAVRNRGDIWDCYLSSPEMHNFRISVLDDGTKIAVGNDYSALGESRGLLYLSVDGTTWSMLTPDFGTYSRFTCVTSLESGGFWIGGSGGALFYDWHQWRWIEAWYDLEGMAGDITDIAIDRNGDIWFSSCGYGVGVLRGGLAERPPVRMGISAEVEPHSPRTGLSIMLSAAIEMNLMLDLYLAVQTPDGSILFAPQFGTLSVPLLRNVSVHGREQFHDIPLYRLVLDHIPAGTYRWFAACTHAGSMDFASNIASCDWQFE
ncbi:MAG TPA: hypothetical protein VM163_01810 [bacterium]|nr:hypothetical protein [bacterium]